MGKHTKLFNTHSEYETFIQTSNFIKPNISHCVQENDVHYNPIYDYSKDYLTFVAKESGTFTFTPKNNNVISYSTNGGTTWTEGNSVEVSNGDKVMWKGTMIPSSSSPQGIGTFSATGNFDAQGNAMSLLYGDNYMGKRDLTGKDYAFFMLFRGNTKVVNTENLSLPATTLANTHCYGSMFYGCTSLVTAPVLPAITLANYCYAHMFRDCTSLVTAPNLSSTTLAKGCYSFMFMGCTSLEVAPILPAITLISSCYSSMFNGCTNLSYIKAMFTTAPGTSSDYTYNWVSDVASSGTFVKNSAASWNERGVSGIPTGWIVQTASA